MQSMIGAARDYVVIPLMRPHVIYYHTRPSRSRSSDCVARSESLIIKARFEEEGALLLNDGRLMPFYQLHNNHVLPCRFVHDDAECACALLLNSTRAIPRGPSSSMSTHDDNVYAALRRENTQAFDVDTVFTY